MLAAEQVTNPEITGVVLRPLADHLAPIRDIASHDSTYHTTTIENHHFHDSFGNLQSEANTAIDLLFGFTARPRRFQM